MRSTPRQRSPYRLGVDLGTTFTACGLARGGRAEIVTLGVRAPVVPTLLHRRDDGTFLVGEAAENRAVTEPDRVAREFKRRLGDPTPLLLGGQPVDPTSLYAEVLHWVVGRAAATEGTSPELVAVTHPATWGGHRLRLMAEAIDRSGLSLDTLLLPEPVAAATYYRASRPLGPGEVFVVYDFGGGTFDVAVVRELEGSFELAGPPEGLEHLGGIDIDAAVLGHVDEALGGALADLDLDDPGDLADAMQLRRDCTLAKEALSADTQAVLRAHVGGRSEVVRITRGELESRIRPTIEATLTATRQALRSADVSVEEVAAFLLVGGSSRIPLVTEMVGDRFGRPVAVDAHPKHVVALGAALHAADTALDDLALLPPGADGGPPKPPPLAVAPARPAVIGGTVAAAPRADVAGDGDRAERRPARPAPGPPAAVAPPAPTPPAPTPPATTPPATTPPATMPPPTPPPAQTPPSVAEAPPPPPRPRRRRGPVVAAVAAAVAVAVLAAAGAGWALLARRDDADTPGNGPSTTAAAGELAAPRILAPPSGSTFAVGEVVDIVFEVDELPEGAALQLFVNEQQVAANPPGSTFQHTFTEAGEARVTVRLVSPPPSSLSEDSSMVVLQIA